MAYFSWGYHIGLLDGTEENTTTTNNNNDKWYFRSSDNLE